MNRDRTGRRCARLANDRLQGGVTLIEMMVAMAVLAIILGIAVPSFQTLIENDRVSGTTNELVGALQLARSEAIKRHASVTVCRRKPNDDICENGTDWTSGWLVTDSSGNAIRAWDALGGTLSLTGPSAGIEFLGSGLVNKGTIDLDSPEFVASPSDCSGDQQRSIEISATGQVSSTKGGCQ